MQFYLKKFGIALVKAEKSTSQHENNRTFNIAYHSSLLNKCSGNAFPIAAFPLHNFDGFWKQKWVFPLEFHN